MIYNKDIKKLSHQLIKKIIYYINKTINYN